MGGKEQEVIDAVVAEVDAIPVDVKVFLSTTSILTMRRYNSLSVTPLFSFLPTS